MYGLSNSIATIPVIVSVLETYEMYDFSNLQHFSTLSGSIRIRCFGFDSRQSNPWLVIQPHLLALIPISKQKFIHTKGGRTGMNKTELVMAIADKTGLSKKDVDAALKAFTETVAETVKAGDKVQLIGFGTFEQAIRPARDGKNPSTGETIHIPESRSMKWKAGKSLKERLNQ